MKITMIQIDLVMGARVLLSLLLRKGYEVKSLQINIRYCDVLSQDDLDIIYEYVGDSDVVGLSFNTFYTMAAEKLALFLKKKGIKYIITGGNHATALPLDVIAFSDIVVKYEAEITLPKVLEALKAGGSLKGISGILYKSGGSVIDDGNPPEIVKNLDILPFQSIDTGIIKYFSQERKIYTPEKSELFPNPGNCYFILASRGCPFACTYCSNSLYHAINKGFNTVRKRSIINTLEEMEYALNNGFDSFYITDDHFFSFTLEEIEFFSKEYKERIRKPFSVVGLNPNSFRSASAEKKLKLLIGCGLTDIRIGIQSGSNRTLKIFKRNYKAEEIERLLAPIERNKSTIWPPPYDKLHVALDFICDAVWEEEEDKVATIKLAQKVLSQYTIFFYTLVYLPGTELYTMAIQNHWIDSIEKDVYLRGIAGVDDNIYNRILFLIAVTKERGITLSERLTDNILMLSRTDQGTAKDVINIAIECINGIEKHYNVNTGHATLHPYLTGFNEWTKTTGETGRKVLFRSYHKPYG